MTKKKNILTLVLSEKKILNEAKNHNPPFKLNGQSLTKDFSSYFKIRWDNSIMRKLFVWRKGPKKSDCQNIIITF
jgi:hypothetical protein